MFSPRDTPADLTAPLDDESFYAGDPFPHFARLRSEAPVAWNAARGYWALSRHAEVLEVSRDPATFCSGKGILTMEIGVEYPFPPTMMHTDPPAHTRYRKLVQPGFAPSVIRALERSLRGRVAKLLDGIAPNEAIDFTKEVAVPIPLMVISDLLGLVDVDYHRFFMWSEAAIPGASDMTWEETQRWQADMRDTLLAFTLSRRGKEGEDVTTVLANSVVDGEQLSDDEILMFQNQLLVAGNETTRNMMSGGMWALATTPGEWQRLADNRTLLPTAVEEWLRWTSPVIAFMRTATRDAKVDDVPIAKGDPLLLLYASANRDEAAFGPTASRFDVARDPNPHVAFGYGQHFCLGAALARLEGRVLLEELLQRFNAVEPGGPLVRTRSSVIAGITRAPLVFRRKA
jgi:cytochrome P450